MADEYPKTAPLSVPEKPAYARHSGEDRFDHVESTGRVGAHRVTSRPRFFWQFLIAGLLGFALLTAAGIFWVRSVGSITELPLAQESEVVEPKAVEGKLDPDATVVVFDGTEAQTVGSVVDQTIIEKKWGQVVFSTPAAEHDIAKSTVYYAEDADESAARGLAEKLGGLPIEQTSEFSDYEARLFLVIGADYAGPGSDDAAS